VNIQQAAPSRQAITNEDVRLSIIRMAQKNGGMKTIAERSGIGYSALWNQVNRSDRGVLAYAIPAIVKGTGDARLLSLLADACGFMVAPKPKYLRTRREIHRQGNGLTIAVGRALEVIEQALVDGLINSLEREQIRGALCRVCSNSLEIGATIENGPFLRKRGRR
jgi:hypothetical protein